MFFHELGHGVALNLTESQLNTFRELAEKLPKEDVLVDITKPAELRELFVDFFALERLYVLTLERILVDK